jgi:GTP cyclohydrolase II
MSQASTKRAAEEEVSSSSTEAVPMPIFDDGKVINLTTHEGSFGAQPLPMNWGAKNSMERGPVLATVRHQQQRNAIGAHSGGYSIYKALAVAQGTLDPDYIPKLKLTQPVVSFGPFPSWYGDKIVSMDPLGHMPVEAFAEHLEKGYDIRPTIAVTKAHIDLPECKEAIRLGRLVPDGDVLTADGQSHITKVAAEPVWYLPGIAERFGVTETNLRQALFRETNMMYPELVTRPDLKVFLPPVGGFTIYIWGDPAKIPDESVELTVRVHDECNGSDVFGSDICTCRPYLTHAIEECIRTAQNGGTGVVIYYRKEGRALGEVTKYLVYNMRKRQEGGDQAKEYFNCTQHVAGVTDSRFQAIMPDPLHWLGVTKIHKLVSMSNMKYDAIVGSGIEVVERVPIPPELVPKDAAVEITAKVFEGYDGGSVYAVDAAMMSSVMGRDYDYKKTDAELGAATTREALLQSGEAKRAKN